MSDAALFTYASVRNAFDFIRGTSETVLTFFSFAVTERYI